MEPGNTTLNILMHFFFNFISFPYFFYDISTSFIFIILYSSGIKYTCILSRSRQWRDQRTHFKHAQETECWDWQWGEAVNSPNWASRDPLSPVRCQISKISLTSSNSATNRGPSFQTQELLGEERGFSFKPPTEQS